MQGFANFHNKGYSNNSFETRSGTGKEDCI